MMRKLFYQILPFFVALSCFVACERNDDEPVRPEKPISRLFISTSDYQATSGSTPYDNIFIINESDAADVGTTSRLRFASAAKGGGVVLFSDSANLVFQSSANSPSYVDTTIYVMGVSNTGGLARAATIRNRLYNNIKGLGYNSRYNQLYAVNNGEDTVSVFTINSPRTQGDYTRPARQLMITEFVPWGMWLNGLDMYLAKTGNNGGVVVYRNFVGEMNSRPAADTLITNLAPSYTLTVSGTSNIRGIAYSRNNDVLVLTDYSAGTGGRVLIFENFSSYTDVATIVPDRIITSSSLRQPNSIAIDDRTEAGSIYVADPLARRVFRFSLEDDGSVEPNGQFSLGTANGGNAPMSLSLYTKSIAEN